MITAVTTDAHKRAFAVAIGDTPVFRAVMGTDLALWADNPGAPVKLYLADDAALCLRGGRAMLCGAPRDAGELCSFLQLCGVNRLLCSAADACPAGWRKGGDYYLFTLDGGAQLPMQGRPLPLQGGSLTLTDTPPMQGVAALLFAGDAARQDYFYTTACTAISHGIGQALALMQGGAVAATVGCYERAGGEAYMAAGITAEPLRGQGIGSWLIATLANRLAAENKLVTLLCEGNLCDFYAKMGFIQIGKYTKYITNSQ